MSYKAKDLWYPKVNKILTVDEYNSLILNTKNVGYKVTNLPINETSWYLIITFGELILREIITLQKCSGDYIRIKDVRRY